ncbi:MAG: oligosaccharide flippase family protein [Verrucomicrobiota bacterium]
MSGNTQFTSRAQRFLNGLITGYAALGFSVVYTLMSVPLALHYLSKEEFGLWALITQLTGYLMLLECGMSGSIARFLSNYKDNMDGGKYGSVLVTGFVIFLLQGLTVMVLGILFVIAGSSILGIPPHLKSIFTQLGTIQACMGGVSLMTRAAAAPLWPHQRLDIHNLGSIACQIGSLLTLWLGFQAGWKLYSLLAAAVVGYVLGFVINSYSCYHLRLYPTKGHWGRFDMHLFRRMFSYGSGLFVLNLGTQLVSTSQVIVISRGLGLESASIWAVASKLSALVQQFVGRIFETSASGLVEMQVREETAQLQRRFHDLFVLTSTIAALGAVGLALFNQPFVAIWTSGKISWPIINDSLLGVVIFLYCTSKFHVGFASLSKDVHKIKYVCLAEGVLFVASAFPLSAAYGLTGILLASIVASVVINFGFATLITSRHLGKTYITVVSWVARPALLIAVVMILYATFAIDGSKALALHSVLSIKIAAYLLLITPAFVYIGLPARLRTEILDHVASTLSALSARLSPRPR